MAEDHEEIIEEEEEKAFTLVFLKRVFNDKKQVLLGMKKRGFGAGKWNGFGGKVEKGESLEEGAIREVEEECSIVINEILRLGYLVFIFPDQKQMKVHVYVSYHFTGEAVDSEEMAPNWYDEEAIDAEMYSKMWSDDKYWFPFMFLDQKFVGRFLFNEENEVEDYTLKQQ